MTQSMKRIHKVTIKHIHEHPLQHSDECVEVNDKRGPYQCECETIGIRADAEVHIPTGYLETPIVLDGTPGKPAMLIQHITSGGLWGIEANNSYQDNSYVTDIEQEQLSELRDQLHAIGFSNRAISAGMRDIKHENV